jgi:hypothetical protein
MEFGMRQDREDKETGPNFGGKTSLKDQARDDRM